MKHMIFLALFMTGILMAIYVLEKPGEQTGMALIAGCIIGLSLVVAGKRE